MQVRLSRLRGVRADWKLTPRVRYMRLPLVAVNIIMIIFEFLLGG